MMEPQPPRGLSKHGMKSSDCSVNSFNLEEIVTVHYNGYLNAKPNWRATFSKMNSNVKQAHSRLQYHKQLDVKRIIIPRTIYNVQHSVLSVIKAHDKNAQSRLRPFFILAAGGLLSIHDNANTDACICPMIGGATGFNWCNFDCFGPSKCSQVD
ncbi:hypothetical protein ABKN59_001711 [Abortiporus biennis]